MRTVSVRDLPAALLHSIGAAKNGCVVVTRDGKPVALVVDVEGQDWEDLALQTSPAFWKLIQGRRQGRLIPLADARKRLGVSPRRRRAK